MFEDNTNIPCSSLFSESFTPYNSACNDLGIVVIISSYLANFTLLNDTYIEILPYSIYDQCAIVKWLI